MFSIIFSILSGAIFAQVTVSEQSLAVYSVLQESYFEYNNERVEMVDGCFPADFFSTGTDYMLEHYACFDGREYFVLFDIVEKKWNRVWGWQLKEVLEKDESVVSFKNNIYQ